MVFVYLEDIWSKKHKGRKCVISLLTFCWSRFISRLVWLRNTQDLPLVLFKLVKMTEHSVGKLLLIGCMVFVWAVMIAINALSSQKVGRDIGLFLNSTGEISDRYYTQITPAGWTFSIWGIIYAWQAIWIVYVFTTICRQQ